MFARVPRGPSKLLGAHSTGAMLASGVIVRHNGSATSGNRSGYSTLSVQSIRRLFPLRAGTLEVVNIVKGLRDLTEYFPIDERRFVPHLDPRYRRDRGYRSRAPGATTEFSLTEKRLPFVRELRRPVPARIFAGASSPRPLLNGRRVMPPSPRAAARRISDRLPKVPGTAPD